MSAACSNSGGMRVWISAAPPTPSSSPLLAAASRETRASRASAAASLLSAPPEAYTFRIPSLGPPPAFHAKPPSLQVFETHYQAALQFLFLCDRVLLPSQHGSAAPSVFSGAVAFQAASTFFPSSSLSPLSDRAVSDGPCALPPHGAARPVSLEPFPAAVWERHLPALRVHAATSLSARCSLILAAAYATLTCENPREIASFVAILGALLEPPQAGTGADSALRGEARRCLTWQRESAESERGAFSLVASASRLSGAPHLPAAADPFFSSFFAGFLSSSLASLLRTAPAVLPFYRSRITINHLPLLLTLDRGGHWASLLLTLLRYVYTLLLHPPTAVEASAAAAREASLSASVPGPEEARKAEGPASGALGSAGQGKSKDISPTTHCLTVLRFLRQQLDAVCVHPALAASSFFLCSRLLTSSTAGGSLQLVGREAEAVVCGVWSRREGRAAACLLGGREVVRLMGELARLASIRRSVWPCLLHPPEEDLLPLLVSRLGRTSRQDDAGQRDGAKAGVARRTREAELARLAAGASERSRSGDPAREQWKSDCAGPPLREAEHSARGAEQYLCSGEKRHSPCGDCASHCWRRALCDSPPPKAPNPSRPSDASSACSAFPSSREPVASAQETTQRTGPGGSAPSSRSVSRSRSVEAGDRGPTFGDSVSSRQRKRARDSSLSSSGGAAGNPRLVYSKRTRGEALGPSACGEESAEFETHPGEQGEREGSEGCEVSASSPPGSGGEGRGEKARDAGGTHGGIWKEHPPHQLACAPSRLCQACCRCRRKTRRQLRNAKIAALGGALAGSRDPRSLPWLLGELDAPVRFPDTPSLHAQEPAERGRPGEQASPAKEGCAFPRASLLVWLLCLPPSLFLTSLFLPPAQVRDLLFQLSQMQLLVPPSPGDSAQGAAEGSAASLPRRASAETLQFLAQAAGASQQFFFEAFQHNWLFPPSFANALVAAEASMAVSGAGGSALQGFAMFAPFVGDLARCLVLLTPGFATVDAARAPLEKSPSAVCDRAGDDACRGGRAGEEAARGREGGEPGHGGDKQRHTGASAGAVRGRNPPRLQLYHLRLSSPSVVFARWLLNAVQYKLPFPFSVVAAAHARLALCLDWLCFLPPRLLPSSSSASASFGAGSAASSAAQDPQNQQGVSAGRCRAAQFDFACWRTPAGCLQSAEATQSLLRVAVEHSKGTTAKARAAASAAASATALAQQESRLLSSQIRSKAEADRRPGAVSGGGRDGAFLDFFSEEAGRRERLAAAREAAKETVRRATAAGLPTVWAAGAFPTDFLYEAVVMPLLQFLLPCRRRSGSGTERRERVPRKKNAQGKENSEARGEHASDAASRLEDEKGESARHVTAMPGDNVDAEKDIREAFLSSFLKQQVGAASAGGLNPPRYAASSRLARLLPFGFLAFQLVSDAAVLPRDAAGLLDFFGGLLASYSPSSLPLFVPSLATALATFGLLQLFLLPGSPLAAALGRARPPSASLTAAVQNHTLPGLLLRQAGYPIRLAYRSATARGDSVGGAVGRVPGVQRAPAALGAGRSTVNERSFVAPRQQSPSPSDEDASTSRESSQGRPEDARKRNGHAVEKRSPHVVRGEDSPDLVWVPALYLGGNGGQSDLRVLVPLHQLLLHACVAALAIIAQIASDASAFRALAAVCWRPPTVADGVDTSGALGSNRVPGESRGASSLGNRPSDAARQVEGTGETKAPEQKREDEDSGKGPPEEKECFLETSDGPLPFSSGSSEESETDSLSFSQDEDDEAMTEFFFRPTWDPAVGLLLSRCSGASLSSVSSPSARPRPEFGAGCGPRRGGAGDKKGDPEQAARFWGRCGPDVYQLPAFLQDNAGFSESGRFAGGVGVRWRRHEEHITTAGAQKPRGSLALLAAEAGERRRAGPQASPRREEKEPEGPRLGRCSCRPCRLWNRVLQAAAESSEESPPHCQRMSPSRALAFSPSFVASLLASLSLRGAQGIKLQASKAEREAERVGITHVNEDGEMRCTQVGTSLGTAPTGTEETGAADGESFSESLRRQRGSSNVGLLLACVQRALRQSGRRGVCAESNSASRQQPSASLGSTPAETSQQDAKDTNHGRPLSPVARHLLECLLSDASVSSCRETSGEAPERGDRGDANGNCSFPCSAASCRDASPESKAHALCKRICLFVSAVSRDLATARQAAAEQCLVCGRGGRTGEEPREGSGQTREGDAEFTADGPRGGESRGLVKTSPEEEGSFVRGRGLPDDQAASAVSGDAGKRGLAVAELEERKEKARERKERERQDNGRLPCCGALSRQETTYTQGVLLWGCLLAEMQTLQEEARERGKRERNEEKEDQGGFSAGDGCPFVGFLLLCLLARSAEAAAAAARPASLKFGWNTRKEEARETKSGHEEDKASCTDEEERTADPHEMASLLRVYLHLYGVYVQHRMRGRFTHPREVVASDLQLGIPVCLAARERDRSQRKMESPKRHSPVKREATQPHEKAEEDWNLPSPLELLSQCYHLPAYILPLFIGQAPLLAAVFLTSAAAQLETLAARSGLVSVSAETGRQTKAKLVPGGEVLRNTGDENPASGFSPAPPFFCSLCACERAGGAGRALREGRKHKAGRDQDDAPRAPARIYPLFTLPSWHEGFLERQRRPPRDGERRADTSTFTKRKTSPAPDFVSVVQQVLFPRSLFFSSLQWRSCLLAWRVFAREMEIYHLLGPPPPCFFSRPLFSFRPSLSSSLSSSSCASADGDASRGVEQPWLMRENKNGVSGGLPLWLCAGTGQGERQGEAAEKRAPPHGSSVLADAAPQENETPHIPQEKNWKGHPGSLVPSCSSGPDRRLGSPPVTSLFLLPPLAIPTETPVCFPPSPLHLHLLEALLSLVSSHFSSLSPSGGAQDRLGPKGLLGSLLAVLPLAAALRPTFRLLRQTLRTLACAPEPAHAAELSWEGRQEGETEDGLVAVLVSWLLSWQAADASRVQAMIALLKAQPLSPGFSCGEARGSETSSDERERRPADGVGLPRLGSGAEKTRAGDALRAHERERRTDGEDSEDEREEERVMEVWRAEEQGQGMWQRATVQIAAFATRHAAPSSQGDSSVLVVRLGLLRRLQWPEREAERGSQREGETDPVRGGRGQPEAACEVAMADIQRLCELLVSPGPSIPSSAAKP
ncbi:tbc domain-containing protein,related [Neospora caninum Liverpool]|uniref:TBC domain-containing protein, related n=1 Tax=Neospora caninum (strain Liverpool) TaxID=572307 RepID=F0V8K6_NEOCL|nr:tbc domain-containing protein,related [Neospora caninum Liverpool]CBZ50047.1 tbc domain-containing protein,related [Neospora caninum Liverpool]CEL64640.1 TPA: TBC domain-containing protein, related [Neospora caninum Liverpool]|eukprot:XP_003880082.1 tbc domain-containing protein,related [Neospora caninum Liverpool]